MKSFVGIVIFSLAGISIANATLSSDRKEVLENEVICLESLVDKAAIILPSTHNQDHFFIRAPDDHAGLFLFERAGINYCNLPIVSAAAELLPSYYQYSKKTDIETYQLEFNYIGNGPFYVYFSRRKDLSSESFTIHEVIDESAPRPTGNWKKVTCTEAMGNDDENLNLVNAEIIKTIEDSVDQFTGQIMAQAELANSQCGNLFKVAKDKLLKFAGQAVQDALKTKTETKDECIDRKNQDLISDFKTRKAEIIDSLKKCQASESLMNASTEVIQKFKELSYYPKPDK